MTHTKEQPNQATMTSSFHPIDGIRVSVSSDVEFKKQHSDTYRLMKNAPELLEALKEISKADYPKEENSGPEVYRKFQKIALQAIKKAEG